MSDPSTSQRNKNLILKGFREVAAGNLDILRELVHEDFTEHSPGNPSGREAFIAFIAASPVPRADLQLKRILADDDLVTIHYRMTTPEEDLAVVDIWRLVEGRIVEHWDVVQPVPAASEVPNGMF